MVGVLSRQRDAGLLAGQSSQMATSPGLLAGSPDIAAATPITGAEPATLLDRLGGLFVSLADNELGSAELETFRETGGEFEKR